MTARLLTAAAIAFAITAPPAAAAGTVAPLKDCYVAAGDSAAEREKVSLVGEDFTPEAVLDVLVDGILADTVQVDTVGAFRGTVDTPPQPEGESPFTVVVRDPREPAEAITLTSRLTALDVTLRPRRANSSRRVRLRGRGFTRAAPIWAHYLYEGEEQKTVRLTRRPKGRCGRFSVRRRQIPIANPGSGEWDIQIDQRRGYSPVLRPVWVRVPVTVTRSFVEP